MPCATRTATSCAVPSLPQYDPNGYLRGCAPMNLFGGMANITPEAASWIRDPYKVASQWIDQKPASWR